MHCIDIIYFIEMYIIISHNRIYNKFVLRFKGRVKWIYWVKSIWWSMFMFPSGPSLVPPRRRQSHRRSACCGSYWAHLRAFTRTNIWWLFTRTLGCHPVEMRSGSSAGTPKELHTNTLAHTHTHQAIVTAPRLWHQRERPGKRDDKTGQDLSTTNSINSGNWGFSWIFTGHVVKIYFCKLYFQNYLKMVYCQKYTIPSQM